MRVKFDVNSQDITLRLVKEKFRKLTLKGPSDSNEPIMGTSRDPIIGVWLYYRDPCEFEASIRKSNFHFAQLEGLQMREYDPDCDSAYFFNLLDQAVKALKLDRTYSDRMPGGSKIHIIVED